MNTLRSSGEIAELFDIDPQTLRNWCSQFAEFLSVSAKPQDGSHRRFDESDLSVFSLVASMRGDGMKLDEIYAALKNNQRGTPPSAGELALRHNPDMALAVMRGRMMELQTENMRLMDEVERLRDTASNNKMLESMLVKAQEEIARLNREIGRLESKPKD